MNVISRRKIREAIQRHPNCAGWLNRWWNSAKKAEWTSLDDVRVTYASADQVGKRLIFDATDGHRLIVGVSYANEQGKGALFIKGFLTHAEYDKQKWKE